MKKQLLGCLLSAMILIICVGCGAKGSTTEQTETATVREENTVAQKEDSEETEEVIVQEPEGPEEPDKGIETETKDQPEVVEPMETVAPEPAEEPIPEPQVIYTYTDMSAIMYAQKTVNVRDLPDTNGNKVGSLSTNDEITVIGQCNETGWYQFEYNGTVAFVSNDYVSDNKVEAAVVPTDSDNSAAVASTSDFPYQLWTIYYTPDNKLAYFYYTEEGVVATGERYLHNAYPSIYYGCNNYNNLQFGHMLVDENYYQQNYQRSTCSMCDDIPAFVACAAANGLEARSRVATPWRTAEGYKIYKMCP